MILHVTRIGKDLGNAHPNKSHGMKMIHYGCLPLLYRMCLNWYENYETLQEETKKFGCVYIYPHRKTSLKVKIKHKI